MCLIGSATLLRCCNVSRLIPKRGNCSSTVRVCAACGPATLLTNCQLGIASNHAAHIPLFLYPFLNTTSKMRPFEYLRLTSLGVIGALVKVRHPIQSSRPQTIGLTRAHVRLALRSKIIAKRQLYRDSLSAFDGNYPALLANHGNWF